MNDKKTTNTLINQLSLVNGKWKVFCMAMALMYIGDVMAVGSPSLDEVKTAIKELNDSTEQYKKQLGAVAEGGPSIKELNDLTEQHKKQLSDILKNISQGKQIKENYNKLLEAINDGNPFKILSVFDKMDFENFDVDAHYPGAYNDETALICAVRKNNEGLAEMLIKMGADVNLKINGNSALSLTIDPDGNVNTDMMMLLLENGADPNLTSGPNEETPLLKIAKGAKKSANATAVELLTEYGADFDIKDKYGKTPQQYGLQPPKN